VDWQTANHYAASLAKLFRSSPTADEVMAQDKERLRKAERVGPNCANRVRTVRSQA
jgi:hypothetical protein